MNQPYLVIASEAKQSRAACVPSGLPRAFGLRNDGKKEQMR